MGPECSRDFVAFSELLASEPARYTTIIDGANVAYNSQVRYKLLRKSTSF